MSGAAMLSVDFSTPPPIPDDGRERASALLATGYLHRYREGDAAHRDVADLEQAFATLLGARYAVAVNSCGSALFLSLLAAGLEKGEPVLMNAFTLGPVPGAIVHASGVPVLVETDENLVIDCDDLAKKARASGARFLLLSHMRGHLADMHNIRAMCEDLRLTLIEDCAHTLGASFDGVPSGRFGKAGCFSLQSYKHVNAGEGGMIITDDPDLAARAILHSGSYMLYAQHTARPDEATFERWRYACPNFSLRMSNLTAAIALPQLAQLALRRERWNASHDRLASGLLAIDGIELPERHSLEAYCQSSIQFRVTDLQVSGRLPKFLERCRKRGVPLKWFGGADAVGYTSRPDHWRYLPNLETPLRTRAILETLFDLRIPLELSPRDCDMVVAIVAESLDEERAGSLTASGRVRPEVNGTVSS